MSINIDTKLFDAEPKKSGLLDKLRFLQLSNGFISDEDIENLSAEFETSQVEIEGVATFYHFLHRKNAGKHTIYLNDSLTSKIKGFDRVKDAFEKELNVNLGTVDRTGNFGLFSTPCIGLCDHEPSALIDFYPFTHLNGIKIKQILEKLEKGEKVEDICDEPDDNIMYTPSSGSIFFADYEEGEALKNATKESCDEILEILKKSQLAGRGGAFFPVWKKWSGAKNQEATPKFIICNADEGEPGTFKDRVLLNRETASLIEGMTIAGFTVGAEFGIIYLRGEYLWLRNKIQQKIDEYREKGLLGKNILGKEGFNFDIRIQMGAGSYVCGEKSALLESIEGKRGEPRTRIYSATARGYLQKPTVINNVETYCAAARIFQLGVEKYLEKGIPGSPGTILLSVSGDCEKPGIYEIEFGMTIAELLELSGAHNPNFIQFGGPSGECFSMNEKYMRISMLKLASQKDIKSGGAFTIYSSERNIIDILMNYSSFFKSESCGVCTPCRAGNFLIQRKLEKLKNGLASEEDLQDLKNWGKIMKISSRCGLGKSAPNSLILALERFDDYFKSQLYKVKRSEEGFEGFDLETALEDYNYFKN